MIRNRVKIPKNFRTFASRKKNIKHKYNEEDYFIRIVCYGYSDSHGARPKAMV